MMLHKRLITLFVFLTLILFLLNIFEPPKNYKISKEESSASFIPKSQTKTKNIIIDISSSKRDLKPLNNILYINNLLIFQATYGFEPSSYYLMALNLKSGELKKIHKGWHRRFFVEGNKFYFEHCEKFFFSSINDITNYKSMECFIFDENNLYIPSEKELPEDLKKLDWEHIYCVYEDYFTNNDKKELIMITGYSPEMKVGIFGWMNNKFGLTHVIKISNQSNISSDLKVFRQALFHDYDRDGLREITILIDHPIWTRLFNENSLFILKFNKKTQKFTIITNSNTLPLPIDEPEITLSKDEVYISGESYEESTFENRKLIHYKITPDLVSFKSINFERKDLEPLILINKPLLLFKQNKNLDSIISDNELADISDSIKVESKKFPFISIPPKYSLKNKSLNKNLLNYIEERNKCIEAFVDVIDSGKNIFANIDKIIDIKGSYHFWYGSINSFFNFNDENGIKYLKSIKPINISGKKYIVCIFNDKGNLNCGICLFDEDFNLLDVTIEFVNEGDDVDIYNWFKYGDILFLEIGGYRANYYLEAFEIKNTKLKKLYNIYNNSLGYIFFNNKLYFKVINYNGYLDISLGGGNGSSITTYDFIDPLTGEYKNTQVKPLIEAQLDYFYAMNHFFDTSIAVPTYESQLFSGSNFIERAEKVLFYDIETKLAESYD
jgi:hypothetical protein